MFVQSKKFVEAHGGRIDKIYFFGQESNPTTGWLAKMNLTIRSMDNNLDSEHDDSFHPDLKADFLLANPPYNFCALGWLSIALFCPDARQ